MLILQVKEKHIENLTPEEEFIRGTVGAKCQINFDEFWQGYEKYIVFKRAGYEPINIMVDSLENEIEIPYTILAEIGEFKIGVFGITETETLPTLYSKDIKILYGTDTHGTTPPTYIPSEIDQLRLSKQDKLTAGSGIKIENNVISSDYELLENKPQINGVELLGNKSLTDLGIYIPTKTSELENDSGFIDDTAFENYYTKTEVDEKTVIDQTYSPISENAQSGKAVAEALATIPEITIDQTYNAESENAQSGKAVAEALAIEQKRSDNTFANALKGNASGSAISVNDVSIVEHSLGVRVASKNLLAIDAIIPQNNVYISNGIISQIDSDTNNSPTVKLLSYNNNDFVNAIKNTPVQLGIISFVFTKDNTFNRLVFGLNGSVIDTTVSIDLSTFQDGDYVIQSNFTNITQGSVSWQDMQVEVGTTATAYTPYVPDLTAVKVIKSNASGEAVAEYTPNADGTVDGVTSLYPNTTLMTDTEGVLIDCEYNRDINKAFAELQQAIISLGGNV